MKRFILMPALLITLVAVTPCHGFQARVTGVLDGDTIEVLQNGRTVRVRLYGVDAPERNQDFGLKAMQLTSSMIFGRDVEIIPEEVRDPAGFVTGIIRIGGDTVNRRLVLLGLAWVNPSQCRRHECREWVKLQDRAIAKEKGLWSQTMTIPPWEYKKIVPKSGKLPNPIDQTKIAKIEAKCRKCGKVHKHYIRFASDTKSEELARKGGYLPFPENDEVTCACGSKIDLSGPRMELQSATGRRKID